MTDDLTPDDPLHPDPEPPYVTPSTSPSAPPSGPPTEPPPVAVQADSEDPWFAAAPDASTSLASKPRGLRTWVAAGVGAAVIAAAAVGGISVASSHSTSSASTVNPGAAAGPGGQAGAAGRGGNVGTVVSVSGSTLTMKAQRFGSSSTQTLTVNTTSSTAITEAVTGSVSQIKAGDHLVIMGTTSGTKVAATQIEDRGTASAATAVGGTGAPPPNFAGGTGGPPGMGAGGAPVTGTVTGVDGLHPHRDVERRDHLHGHGVLVDERRAGQGHHPGGADRG